MISHTQGKVCAIHLFSEEALVARLKLIPWFKTEQITHHTFPMENQ